MIFVLPSHFYTSSLFPSTASPSFILHERSANYYWSGQSLLSIKMFFSGRALYTLGRGYYAVDDASYLLVNHDQPYSIAIESEHPVESFCIFFAAGFAEEVYRSLTRSTSFLLAEPLNTRSVPLSFFERTYPHDTLVSPLIFQLRASLAQATMFNTSNRPDDGFSLAHIYEKLELHDVFCNLVSSLLQVRLNVFREIEALPALRASTRFEVYRRLYLAKEYATAFFDRPLTIPELAQIAFLSPSHFLRLFKQVFQQTPHQYLTGLRLHRAQNLLLHTDRPVTDICFSLGFESLGSFSWLFHQHLGCSPSEFRLRKK